MWSDLFPRADDDIIIIIDRGRWEDAEVPGWRRTRTRYGWFYHRTCCHPDWWGWTCRTCGDYVHDYGRCHQPDWMGWWCSICNIHEDGSVFGLQVCPRRGRLYFRDDCAECHEQLPLVHRRTGSTYNYRICPACCDDIVGFLKRRLRVLTNHGTTDIIMGFLTSLR